MKRTRLYTSAILCPLTLKWRKLRLAQLKPLSRNTPHPRNLLVGVKTWYCGHLSIAKFLSVSLITPIIAYTHFTLLPDTPTTRTSSMHYPTSHIDTHSSNTILVNVIFYHPPIPLPSTKHTAYLNSFSPASQFLFPSASSLYFYILN